MTRLISNRQIEETYSMADCIAAVAEAFGASARGDLQVRPRVSVPGGPQARLHGLIGGSGGLGYLVAHLYSGLPAGADKQAGLLPDREKIYALFSTGTGRCEAVLGGRYLAWIKTGATGALAIDRLAAADATRLALIGTGRQATIALLGALQVRDITRVRAWSRRRDRLDAFVARHRESCDITAADDARSAVDGADIVITATTSPVPVVEAAWLAPGSHLNAIGAHYPDRREVDTDTVAGADVFVDSIEVARAEKGDLLLPAAEGRFDFADVRAELGQVVDGTADWTRRPGVRTVFGSSGSAVEAVGAAIGAYRAVAASGPVADFDFAAR